MVSVDRVPVSVLMVTRLTTSRQRLLLFRTQVVAVLVDSVVIAQGWGLLVSDHQARTGLLLSDMTGNTARIRRVLAL